MSDTRVKTSAGSYTRINSSCSSRIDRGNESLSSVHVSALNYHLLLNYFPPIVELGVPQ